MTTGGTASQWHCEAYKHFSQLHLEPALVLILNSLSIPVLKNAKNKEENIQEMELWNPGHARESKQADASTYSLTSVDVASVQEPFDSRKWAFIVAGLLVISNQLQHLFSYWYIPFFFLLEESSDSPAVSTVLLKHWRWISKIQITVILSIQHEKHLIWYIFL